MKKRLDQVLVERRLAESRSQARGLILAAKVRLAGAVVDKAGALIPEGAPLSVEAPPPFVSRGGLKLAAALDTFSIGVAGSVALDAGASTGGFVDCLLKRGAARVFAVDVGYGQLHMTLRADPRVVLRERCNARYLSKDDLGCPLHLWCADLSFISVTKVLPALASLSRPGTWAVVLVKPQFESRADKIGRGGILRDMAEHRAVLQRVRAALGDHGFAITGSRQSPILGAKGNLEYLMVARKGPDQPEASRACRPQDGLVSGDESR